MWALAVFAVAGAVMAVAFVFWRKQGGRSDSGADGGSFPSDSGHHHGGHGHGHDGGGHGGDGGGGH
jgi:hypothetical protein